MDVWLQSGAVLLIGIIATAVAWRVASLKTVFWLTAFAIMFFGVILLGICRWFPRLEFVFPFSFLNAGRREFALFAMILPVMIGILVFKTEKVRLKAMLGFLGALAFLQYSLLPFISPAFSRVALRNLQTEIDPEGVCLQRTDYTCGPAAAVTVLAHLGLKAEEGAIGLDAYSSPFNGTFPDLLEEAINRRFGGKVRARRIFFRSTGDLQTAIPCIAVIKHSFLVDHYVAVLRASDTEIVVGDPLLGKVTYSTEEFKKMWRHECIVVSRK